MFFSSQHSASKIKRRAWDGPTICAFAYTFLHIYNNNNNAKSQIVIPKSHVCGSTSLLQRTKAARDESLVPEPW